MIMSRKKAKQILHLDVNGRTHCRTQLYNLDQHFYTSSALEYTFSFIKNPFCLASAWTRISLLDTPQPPSFLFLFSNHVLAHVNSWVPLLQREGDEGTVCGGGPEVPGGSSWGSDPRAAAGEGQARSSENIHSWCQQQEVNAIVQFPLSIAWQKVRGDLVEPYLFWMLSICGLVVGFTDWIQAPHKQL